MFFLWFFSVGIVDGFRSAFRSAPRPAFLVSFLALSLVSLLDPFCPFRSSLRSSVCLSFRLFVWAYRGAVRLGRGGVWGGAVGLSSGVAR